jgi:hypothetical protein
MPKIQEKQGNKEQGEMTYYCNQPLQISHSTIEIQKGLIILAVGRGSQTV